MNVCNYVKPFTIVLKLVFQFIAYCVLRKVNFVYLKCALLLSAHTKGLKECKSNRNPLCASMKNGDEFHYICRNIVGSETKGLTADADCDHG